MSGEDFLTRWSRRKREVAAAENVAPPAADASHENKNERDTHEADAQAAIEALPPLESITELSDITAFLKAGVPADLTRAALRRVWTVDPSIRDFVGLAENAWDFTDPGAIPGFGPLEDTDDIRRMIAQIVDEIGRSSKSAIEATPNPAEISNYSNVMGHDENKVLGEPAAEEGKFPSAQDVSSQVLLQSAKDYVASQHNVPEAVDPPDRIVHRGHGRALPR